MNTVQNRLLSCKLVHCRLVTYLLLFLLCSPLQSQAQWPQIGGSASASAAVTMQQPINSDWKVRNMQDDSWMDAQVPGNILNNLILYKKVIAPYYGANERLVQWVDSAEWQYGVYFDIDPELFKQKNIDLVFEGLDTYCSIYLNGIHLTDANNAFRKYRLPIKAVLLQAERNYLTINFKSIVKTADSLAKKQALVLPTDVRAFVRRPQFSFGWDFAPRMVTSGITGDVYLQGYEKPDAKVFPFYSAEPIATFDLKKFQFIQAGKPVFIKGVNIVPPRVIEPITNGVIDKMLSRVTQLGINMVRVWGGGNYMPDYFYEQCSKKRIMVWQDLMFANALVPPTEIMRKSILQEVEDNVRRLMKYDCIVLWCGNNEIDEAWHNGGWAKKYKQADSAILYSYYKSLWERDIPDLIRRFDKFRPYIPSSPKYGWGNKLSLSNADAHYWGVWWGKEPIEQYYEAVPRFMSAYGMQALPDLHSIMNMCERRDINSDSINFSNHQKHPTGFETIRYYLQDYPQHFDNLGYIYFTNLLQRDAIRTAVSAQRTAYPYCNGSMLWQFNDCWPAISWSIVDFYDRPKAAFYELKHAYGPNYLTLAKQVYENDKNIINNETQQYVLSLCGADFDPSAVTAKTKLYVYDFNGELIYKTDKIQWQKNSAGVYYSTSFFDKAGLDGFSWNMQYIVIEITRFGEPFITKPFFLAKPADLLLPPVKYNYKWSSDTTLLVSSDALAKDVYLRSTNSDTEFGNNYFSLLPNQPIEVTVKNFNHGKDSLKVYSSIDFAY